MTSKVRLQLITLFVAVCFAPLIEGGTTRIPVFILEILVLSLALVHVRSWLAGGSPVLVVAPRLDFPVALFFAAALVSLFIAPYKYMALTWVRLITFYCLFYLLARATLRGRESHMLPVIVIMSMGLVEIIVAGRHYLLGMDRVSGTFFNPNMLAGYITVPAVFALSFIAMGGGHVRGKPARVLLAGLYLASLLIIVLSGSRGGVVSFAAGSLVVLWFRNRLFTLVFAGLIVAGVFLVPNPVRDRINSSDPFAYSRLGIWSSAARMAADHPSGVGLGNFKYESGRYSFPIENSVIRYGKKMSTAHNEYLHFTAEMGVPGLAAILCGLYVLLAALRSSAIRPADESERPVTVGAFGAVCAVLSHSLVDSNFHEPGIVFLFIFTVCIGMEAGALRRTRIWHVELPEANRKRAAALACVLVFLLAAWSVKDMAADYFFRRATEAMRTSGPDAAIVPAERALMLEQGQAKYHEQMASIYYALFGKTGDDALLAKAIESLSVAEGLNPNYPLFPSIAASIKVAAAGVLNDPADRHALYVSARDDIGRALQSTPYDAELIFRKAELHAQLGETGKAEDLLVRLRELEPNFLRGRLALAQLYSSTGRDLLSRDEYYSIIGTNKELSRKRLNDVEARFVLVDMDKVGKLLDSLEARVEADNG